MVDVLFTRVDWSECTNTDGAKKRREEGNKESVQGQHLYRETYERVPVFSVCI
jgi:hypothetical protein